MIDFKKPLTITIANTDEKSHSFVPYRENFTTKIQPNQVIALEKLRSDESIYYTKQATDGLVIGIRNTNAKVNLVAGKYADSAFTAGAEYNLIANDNTFSIIGSIPFAAKDDSLGLPAGNRFVVKITNKDITSSASLPSGKIVKTTNTLDPSGYNEYTKSAFEADGSLIFIGNVSNVDTEIMIKWTADSEFETYTIKADKAKLLVAGQTAEDVDVKVITTPTSIKLTNEASLSKGFVLYKENFTKYLDAGDSLTIVADKVCEILYYLKLDGLKVELL